MEHTPAELAGTLSSPRPSEAIYRSTKSYDHSEGLSCCFRQWRAASHCHLLHGYALAFRFVFATNQLDKNNWCLDFGSLKELRQWLHHMFDHTLLVAEDDPELRRFKDMARDGLADIRVVPAVGCEAVVGLTFDHLSGWVWQATNGRVWLECVEVMEHAGNSAIRQVADTLARPIEAG